MALIILLLLGALLLNDWDRLMPRAGFWRGTVVSKRFAEIVPAAVQVAAPTSRNVGSADLLLKILRIIDPSCTELESSLRFLGMARKQWIVAIEMVKLIAALFFAALAFKAAPALTPVPGAALVAPLVAFAITLFAATKCVRGIAQKRRRRILGELTVGIELIMIFLVAGQSLDQALRSMSDMAGQALPRIAPIQRALVADIGNGAPYEKALERWAENLGVEQAHALASMFTQSLMHGIELVPALRQFSDDLSEQRIFAARASIGIKSAQLTVVMVIFFLPAILTFMAAPSISALLAGIGKIQ